MDGLLSSSRCSCINSDGISQLKFHFLIKFLNKNYFLQQEGDKLFFFHHFKDLHYHLDEDELLSVEINSLAFILQKYYFLNLQNNGQFKCKYK